MEEEKADFDDDLAKITIVTGDYPNWEEVLTNFDYQIETEITKVDIEAIESQRLDGQGFLEISEPPALYSAGKSPDEINDPVELASRIKNIVRDIASNLLAEEGIGSHELGYLYGILIDHVSKRMLSGKTVGTANIEELHHAINCRSKLQSNFKNNPGLVTSIIKYKREAKDANQ
jgi:hypothetical protein